MAKIISLKYKIKYSRPDRDAFIDVNISSFNHNARSAWIVRAKKFGETYQALDINYC